MWVDPLIFENRLDPLGGGKRLHTGRRGCHRYRTQRVGTACQALAVEAFENGVDIAQSLFGRCANRLDGCLAFSMRLAPPNCAAGRVDIDQDDGANLLLRFKTSEPRREFGTDLILAGAIFYLCHTSTFVVVSRERLAPRQAG